MILDKLLEKKDVLAYLDLRKKFLQDIKNEEILKLSIEERDFVKERFNGRISELETLLDVLKSGKLKYMGKWYFRASKKISEEKDISNKEMEKVSGIITDKENKDKKTIGLDEETVKKIKQIKDEFPPSYAPDDEEIIKDALELYLKDL